MPWFETLIAFFGVTAIDQLSKYYVMTNRRFAAAGMRPAPVSVRLFINRPMVTRLPLAIVVVTWALCMALALFLLAQPVIASRPLCVAGIGMALGGVTGNVIDLARHRGIVDFIAFGSWTVFNIADVAIIGGLALALLALL